MTEAPQRSPSSASELVMDSWSESAWTSSLLRGCAVVNDCVEKGLVAELSSPLSGCSEMKHSVKHSVTLLCLPLEAAAAMLGFLSKGYAVPTCRVAMD